MDETLRIWDAQTGAPIGDALRVSSIGSCVSESRDGRHIVGRDVLGTTFIWNRDRRAIVWTSERDKDEDEYDELLQDLEAFEKGEYSFGTETTNEELLERHVGDVPEKRDNAATEINIEDVPERRENAATEITSEELLRGDTENEGRDENITDSDESFESRVMHEISDQDAETIIRSCGQETQHLWPESFPVYTEDAYCRHDSVYSNALGEEALLATLPCPISSLGNATFLSAKAGNIIQTEGFSLLH